jgi:hypothetical protein
MSDMARSGGATAIEREAPRPAVSDRAAVFYAVLAVCWLTDIWVYKYHPAIGYPVAVILCWALAGALVQHCRRSPVEVSLAIRAAQWLVLAVVLWLTLTVGLAPLERLGVTPWWLLIPSAAAAALWLVSWFRQQPFDRRLRRGAGRDRVTRAGVDLAIASGWTKRSTDSNFHLGAHVFAADPRQDIRIISWDTVGEALDRDSIPGDAGQLRVLRIAASIAGGGAVRLHEDLRGMTRTDAILVRRAVRRATAPSWMPRWWVL